MTVLENAFTHDLHALELLFNKIVIVKTAFLVCGIASTTFVSYCSDIVAAKNVSAVKHGLNIFKPCNQCIATKIELHNMDKSVMRHILRTVHARGLVRNCRK